MQKFNLIFGILLIVLLVPTASAIEWTRGTSFFDGLYCSLFGCTLTGDLIIGNNNISTTFVGIGTLSPGEKLEVVGGSLNVNGSATDAIRFTHNTGDYIQMHETGTLALIETSTNALHINSASDLRLQATNAGGDIYIASDTAGFIKFRGDATDRMFIDSSGVGIGTISPDEKLEVVGKVKITKEDGVNDYGILESFTDGNFYISSVGVGGAGSEGGIIFRVNSDNTVALTLKPNKDALFTGLVGIGITTPDAPLEVRERTIADVDHELRWTIIASGLEEQEGAHSSIGIKLKTEARVGGIPGERWAGIIAVAETTFGRLPGLAFYTQGLDNGSLPTEKLRIRANGNVGIGIDNPGNKLDVNGRVQAARFVSDVNTVKTDVSYILGNNAGLGMFTPGTNILGLATASSERMRIDADGKVGIGTDSPSSLLEVAGTGNIDLNISGNFYVNSTNVGIGTDKPQELFEIFGGNMILRKAVLSGGVAPHTQSVLIIENSDHARIEIITPTSKTGSLSFSDNQALVGRIDYDHGTDSMSFWAGGSNKMKILSDGKVGIGTLAPTHKLNVIGDSNITSDLIVEGNATINVPYGEMYLFENTIVTIINTQFVWENVTLNTSGELNGFIMDIATGTLTTEIAGVYKADQSGSFSNGNSITFETAIAINDIVQHQCEAQRKLSGGGDIGNAGSTCFIRLVVGDRLNLQIRNLDGTLDPTFSDANLNLFRIGA